MYAALNKGYVRLLYGALWIVHKARFCNMADLFMNELLALPQSKIP